MVVRNSPLPRMSRRGRATIGVLIGVFVLFTLLGWGVDAWTDWLWFDEVAFTQVFTGKLITQLLLFLAVGAAMAVIVGGNLYLAFRLRPMLRPPSAEQATLERYRMVLTPRVGTWIAVLSVIVGLFAGLSAQSRWQDWLLFRNAQPFGIADPEFGVDIGFYVFEYPFWRYLLGAGFTAVVLSVIGALAVHYIFGGVRLQGIGDRMTTAARAHLTSLVAMFVLLKAVAYVLDRRALLLNYNSGTELYGAGYADINALLPAKEILAYISIVVAIAIIVFSNAVMRNLTWPGVSLALLGISAVAIGGIYPWAVQTFEVNPSIRDKEAKYIERSIVATRDAFGVSASDVQAFGANTLTPPAELTTDPSIVPNIRLLDPQLVSETYTQLQQVRGFYDFGAKLDIDRYQVDGKSQDYVVGVREINYSELTDQQNNWINRHTVYTHGYGLVAAPANRVVCNGQPYFVSGFLNDAQEDPAQGEQQQECNSNEELIKVDQPRVYYGEQTREEANDYAIVGSASEGDNAEFDRPGAGNTNTYYTYTGAGGIPIGSLTRRLLYAVKNAETNFLLSDAVNDNSRLMYVRDPRSRVEKVAPFLTIDGDPYPSVVDGKIVWILDGYTTSATYPYSQRINLQTETEDATTGAGAFALAGQDVNYIRNSVKATVDAYDGTVTLYEFDTQDPVLKAWNKAFGGDLIKPKSEIPAALAEHLRYPADLFKVQRNLLSRFHVTDPGGFFTGDDFWAVPNTPGQSDSQTKQPPYYLNTQLGTQTETTFQLTSALSPAKRQNLASIMSGWYDEAGNPQLQVLELPDSTPVLGPEQVFQRMTTEGDARTAISQLTADGAARIDYGNLLSLPFGNGILYVEPIYVQSNDESAYPLLQRVLLSYGDGKYVVLANSITEGINTLVDRARRGQTSPPSTPPDQPGGAPATPAPTGSASPAAPATPTPNATPTAPAGNVSLDQAADRVQAAITEVRNAQQSGDFARYGRALTELDAAMKEWDTAQKAATSPSPQG
ncbi:UPF0182 family membrane protein [Catenuloplanes nepalensis]|nr:UPF0182 family protein [Catenuloplanes nepalensis]